MQPRRHGVNWQPQDCRVVIDKDEPCQLAEIAPGRHVLERLESWSLPGPVQFCIPSTDQAELAQRRRRPFDAPLSIDGNPDVGNVLTRQDADGCRTFALVEAAELQRQSGVAAGADDQAHRGPLVSLSRELVDKGHEGSHGVIGDGGDPDRRHVGCSVLLVAPGEVAAKIQLRRDSESLAHRHERGLGE